MRETSCFRIILKVLLFSVVITAPSATSTSPQHTLLRQDEFEGYTITQNVGQWVRFLLIIAAAAMNTKAPMLWSESRILRKLKARNPYHLRLAVVSKNSDHAFTELYVSLCKGRHRTYSRTYPFLYYLFTFSIDIIDSIELFANGSFEPNVTDSEELTTLRLLIYFGSFATFGAVKLTIWHKVFLALLTVCISTVHFTAGYGLFTLSERTRNVLGICKLIVIMLFFIIYMLYDGIPFSSHNSTTLPDIASNMSSTRERNFGDLNLESYSLRENLTESQIKRLEYMESVASQYNDFDEIKAKEEFPQWRHVVESGAFFVISVLGALSWGKFSADEVPRTVLLESLEAISVFLLSINENTIEKVLFVKLLQIAHISRNEDGRICGTNADGDDYDSNEET